MKAMPARPRPMVTLRPAAAADCELVWAWRNDPESRRSSFDEREIPLAEHRAWFETTLGRTDRRLYVVLAAGCAAGVVRLDRGAGKAAVSINIAPGFRGRGLAASALRVLGEEAFADADVQWLVAEVKAENVASRNAFLRAGFRLESAGDVLTLVRPRATAAPVGDSPGEAPAEARRLEGLWRGSFGREYTDRNAAKGERRQRFWSDLLAAISVDSVLEVGCNVGLNLRWIRPLVARAAGVDVNEYPLPRLRVAVPGVRAAAAAARELPFRDGTFDLVFTTGVLIHVAPDSLALAMREIVRCSRRYVLCGEYFAESPTEVFYRGHAGALFKQDFGARYQELFPGLKLLERGRLLDEDGWDNDEVTFWLFEKAAAGP